MSYEYDCTCRNCGSTWFYNDANIRANVQMANQMKGHLVASVIGAARGSTLYSGYQTQQIEEMAQEVVNYSRCPKCGSVDISAVAVQIYNPFLDDPASSLYIAPESMEEAPEGSKSKVVAGLLGIFLGSFGIHKFYLGYTKEGIITLAVSLIGGFITLGLAMGAMALIGIIEGIIYLTQNNGSFYSRYVKAHKGWF